MFKNKYRIVTDNYAGYECQKKRWWFPFWIQMHDGYTCNTFSTIEEAKRFIENDAKVCAEYTSD